MRRQGSFRKLWKRLSERRKVRKSNAWQKKISRLDPALLSDVRLYLDEATARLFKRKEQ